ncbi:Shedu immune nuclease family protein [Sphingobacterium anhuiense]|uniref:Shedu immune nuclease family protein n=1 Tax=Sphingobacterium anhuiense TaxID=493780 RepID=UPI003C2D0243
MEGIDFSKRENELIFIYTLPSYLEDNWVEFRLEEKMEVAFKKTFYFTEKDRIIGEGDFDEDLDSDVSINESNDKGIVSLDDPFSLDDSSFLLNESEENGSNEFLFGVKLDHYYKLNSDVLKTKNDFYFHESINFHVRHFVAETRISILAFIDRLINEDVYIGGDRYGAMPLEAYEKMIKDFPTTHDKKLYAQARVSSTIKNYFESTEDAEFKFNAYRNKKESVTGTDLIKTFKEYELEKYDTILEKLIKMLKSEESYSEDKWQDEILQIICLLYPKYIFTFKTVYLNIEGKSRRFLDFMLVDSEGNIDVIEIKKPFQNSIMNKGQYRNNYIPHKDLTGTIMQLEKYIFHLNRYGAAGEKNLTLRYRNDLPHGLEISITSPKGFVIMGRNDNLNKEQKSDFEIIKRKYKNVIDIITYDDLLRRLRFTIEQIKKI